MLLVVMIGMLIFECMSGRRIIVEILCGFLKLLFLLFLMMSLLMLVFMVCSVVLRFGMM